jgi:hypothetical protein
MELKAGYEEWKIWPPYEVFYIESMLTITRTTISEYEYIDKIITDRVSYEGDKLILIDLAHNIINQAAALSRYFWPSSKHRVCILRAEKLREKLNIEMDNVLQNRDVRNFVEHFDENLDKFLNDPIAGNILPSYVGFSKQELNEVSFVFRAYFIDEWLFKSLKKEIYILPIVREAYRIHNLLIECKKRGSRLHS